MDVGAAVAASVAKARAEWEAEHRTKLTELEAAAARLEEQRAELKVASARLEAQSQGETIAQGSSDEAHGEFKVSCQRLPLKHSV